jgi:hypothetical protein
MSSTIAAVDVIATHYGARELLRHEVHLVRSFRAAKKSKAPSTMSLFSTPKTIRGTIERFVPRGKAQRSVLAHERSCQPGHCAVHILGSDFSLSGF